MNFDGYDSDSLFIISEYILRELMPDAGQKGMQGTVFYLNTVYCAMDAELKEREEAEE